MGLFMSFFLVICPSSSREPVLTCRKLEPILSPLSTEKSAMMESTVEEGLVCESDYADTIQSSLLAPSASTLIRINELEEKPSQSPTLLLQYSPTEQRAFSKARSNRKNKSSPISFRSCSILPEYFFRIIYYRQMDLDATFYQMITLLLQPSKVYKSAYYRKRTTIIKLNLLTPHFT